MFSSSEELRLFYRKTQYYSTKNLYELEYYLRYNNKSLIYIKMHRIVQIILIDRGEKTLNYQRIEKIDYLNTCLSISNPMGRLSARIIGYICKFIKQ